MGLYIRRKIKKMRALLTVLIICMHISMHSQNEKKIYTEDIDNFWAAYDIILELDNFNDKLKIINELYIDKGTIGLKSFMKLRSYNDTLWVKLIDDLPKFWNSIRPNTLKVKEKSKDIEKSVIKLNQIYPELKDAKMYFTIGGLRSGGTTNKSMVLIGTEIATADSSTDVTEFKSNWLPNVFSKQSIDNLVFLNIHEYIHTQQDTRGTDVLSASIREGACDFIAELVTKTQYNSSYMQYGNNHEEEIKVQFEKEMHTKDYKNWLSNGGKMKEKADLGYFIGYKICKSYFNNSTIKSLAIKNIIELDYSNKEKIQEFLRESKYFH